MNPTPDSVFGSTESVFGSASQPMSRRRLFELGGATAGLAAILAACSKDDAAEPGRVGNAPVPTDPPKKEVDNVVYLRTMQSLELSIVDVYATLAGLAGLGEGTTAALTRFSADHTATAETLAGLTSDNGGEAYACGNAWMMERQFQPALDNIFGIAAAPADTSSTDAESSAPATTEDPWEIKPTDDADRDTLAMINGLETLATATFQKMVEQLTTPALRAQIIPLGAQAARRAAAIAIVAGGEEDRFVSPTLLGAEPDATAVFPPAYAVPTRFGQLTPIDVVIGAENDLGIRFTATFETPADNAYLYKDLVCEA